MIVVCTSGGVKSAVAAATQDRESKFFFLHLNFGQPSSQAEFAAVERYCASIAGARAIQFDLSIAERLKDQLGRSPDQGESRTRDDTGRFAPAVCWGLMPSILWAGVQCAHCVGASTVITGLSRLSDSPHVGLPLAEGQLDLHRPLVHALNITAEILTQQRTALQIEAPLVDLSPSEVIKLGQQLGVSFGDTWSCSAPRRLEGQEWTICNRCTTCRGRELAFSQARIADPASERRSATATIAGR